MKFCNSHSNVLARSLKDPETLTIAKDMFSVCTANFTKLSIFANVCPACEIEKLGEDIHFWNNHIIEQLGGD